jgi:hypothetical protein
MVAGFSKINIVSGAQRHDKGCYWGCIMERGFMCGECNKAMRVQLRLKDQCPPRGCMQGTIKRERLGGSHSTQLGSHTSSSESTAFGSPPAKQTLCQLSVRRSLVCQAA